MTYLEEAHLVTGDARKALEVANVAVEEFDAVHGRTWLVRGDARRALGDLDGAAGDYRQALRWNDELGGEERARARLEALNRSVRRGGRSGLRLMPA